MAARTVCFIEANKDGTVGGSHYCLLDLVRNLDPARYRAHVIFFHEHRLIPEFSKAAEVTVLPPPAALRLSNSWRKFLLPRLCQRAVNAAVFMPLEWLGARRRLRLIRPDVLHLNNSPTAWAWIDNASALAIPVVSHVRGCWHLTARHKRLARKCRNVIAISRYVADDLLRQTGALEGLTTLLDGIDVERFLSRPRRTKQDVHQELNVPAQSLLVGVVGNIKRWKGQHVLLEALARLRSEGFDFYAVIVGAVSNIPDDKLYSNELLELAKSSALSGRVHFTGGSADAISYMAALDVCAHTSTEPEPLGRVVVEAQLLGKPVIATAHGGPCELIQDGVDGFLTAPGNADLLAERLRALLASRDLRLQIGEQARKRASESYAIKPYAEKIMEIYDGKSGA